MTDRSNPDNQSEQESLLDKYTAISLEDMLNIISQPPQHTTRLTMLKAVMESPEDNPAYPSWIYYICDKGIAITTVATDQIQPLNAQNNSVDGLESFAAKAQSIFEKTYTDSYKGFIWVTKEDTGLIGVLQTRNKIKNPVAEFMNSLGEHNVIVAVQDGKGLSFINSFVKMFSNTGFHDMHSVPNIASGLEHIWEAVGRRISGRAES